MFGAVSGEYLGEVGGGVGLGRMCGGVVCAGRGRERGREPNMLKRGGENAMPYPYPFPLSFEFNLPFTTKPECAESGTLTLGCTPEPRLS